MRRITAFCPNCQKEAVMEAEGLSRRCTVCGFAYNLDPGGVHSDGSALGVIALIFKGLGYALLGIAGFVALALAIAFVGCLVH